jgi:hypothetical protein
LTVSELGRSTGSVVISNPRDVLFVPFAALCLLDLLARDAAASGCALFFCLEFVSETIDLGRGPPDDPEIVDHDGHCHRG